MSPRPSALSLDELSGRERVVLAQVAAGLSNNAVARVLALSERTVDAHMRSIFVKLGLRDDQSINRRVLAVVAYLSAPRP